MRRSSSRLCPLLILIPICIGGVSCLPKVQPSTVELPDSSTVQTREARGWVYEIANKLAGILELAADRIIEQAEDPMVRHNALEWKAAAIPALQRASFQPNPVLAIADVWLFTIQMQNALRGDFGRRRFGEHALDAAETTGEMEEIILQFIVDKGGNPRQNGNYDAFHKYAVANPIVGSISSRPTAGAILVDRVRAGKVGAIATLGSLVEGFADLSDRLSVYGEQLPKQARWQAELLLFDIGLDKVDFDAVVEDMARIGRTADVLTGFADGVPIHIDKGLEELLPPIEQAVQSVDLTGIYATFDDIIAAQLAVALAAVTAEREAVIDEVREERVAATADVERLANQIVDRSFTQLETLVGQSIRKWVPVGAALIAGPFLLGLLAGWVLRRK